MKDVRSVLSVRTKEVLRNLMYSWRYPRDIIYCIYTLGYWSPSWRLYGTPIIKKHRNAKIKIGKGWQSCSDPQYNSIGVFQKVTIKALLANAEINIGENVGMSGVSIACFNKVEIGSNTLLGSGCMITDNDAHGISPKFRNSKYHIVSKPVIIEDSVFIGARSIILKGVRIGSGAVVGAGSVVSRDVPSMAIVAGNPAKVIGDVRDPKHSMEHIW